MHYKIKSVNIIILFFSFIFFLLITVGGSAFLSLHGIVSKNNPFLAVLLFGGFIGAFLILFLVNHKTIVCSIHQENLIVKNKVINWAEIKSYKISNDSPQFTSIRIKIKSGKSITISHRNKFRDKDGFENFLAAFEDQVTALREVGFTITKTPLIWDTPAGKIYGYILIAIMLAFTIAIFTRDITSQNMINFLVFVGCTIPLLRRIFRRNKYNN